MKPFLTILVILALAAGAYYVLFTDDGSASSELGADRHFAVENISQVHKIFIADRSGKTTTLTRDGSGWLLNDKYVARQGAVKNVLEVIENVEMKYIPPKAALESITRDMAKNGIKVELYDSADRNIKTFYVGGMTNDESGTHFIMEGSDQPYVMHLPYWNGGLKYRFLMDNEDWRDRHLIQEDPEDITMVRLIYPKQQGKGFDIRKQGSSYYLQSDGEKQKVDASVVMSYLDDFTEPVAEAYHNDKINRDSFLSLIPFALLEYATTDQDTHRASFHPIAQLDDGFSKVERMYVGTSQGDFLLVQMPVFQKMFQSQEFFLR